MERNTIELTAHTITIVDENTVIKYAVPDPVCTGGVKEVSVFEKIHHNYTNIPSPQTTKIVCAAQLLYNYSAYGIPTVVVVLLVV
jgi:hypothetical protein